MGHFSPEDFQGENEHTPLLDTHLVAYLSPVPPPVTSSSSSASALLTQVACQKRPSGNLVSILSGAEASFVASLVKNQLNSYSNIWIGFHDPTEVR